MAELRSVSVLLVAGLLMFGAARAGEPVTVDVTCPIDGEVFAITSTPGCTYFGITMSFWRVTSCDFVTDLPVCPGNGLPLYREFSEHELDRVRQFMSESAYSEARTVSPYYLAWAIEDHLGTDDVSIKSFMLAHGLARDTDNTLVNPRYLDLLVEELSLTIQIIGADERPFVEALKAFVLVHAGRKDEASGILDTLSGDAANADNTYLMNYVDSIGQCIADPASKYCDPSTEVPRV